jgi:hypothetical protein
MASPVFDAGLIIENSAPHKPITFSRSATPGGGFIRVDSGFNRCPILLTQTKKLFKNSTSPAHHLNDR